MLELSAALLPSSSTVLWGITGSPLCASHPLTRDQSQRLRLPEEVGATSPHRFLPFRFPVNLSPSSRADFRFHAYRNDFESRGNHETPGRFAYGGFDSDIVDVNVVVKHLKSEYGYVVTMMVSHSRASMVTMRYLCTYEKAAADVRCFVNVAGRYRMVRPSNVMIGFWGSPVD